MYDFTSIGELLIDFTPVKNRQEENLIYEQHVGGAPANVASILALLGWKATFIGKVGDDSFGRFCKETLSSIDLDVSNIILSKDYNTTLAFVHLSEDGDRDFTFYRRGMADTSLSKEDIPTKVLSNTRVFHFGSVSLTQDPAREATIYAVGEAKNEGAIISYDPNLRVQLWDDINQARSIIIHMLKYADILKISEEEGEFIFGEKDCKKLAYFIYNKYNIPFVYITRGDRGSVSCVNGGIYNSLAYNVQTINTTGAGDSALAGVIHNILNLNKPILSLKCDEIMYMLDFANALGSLVTTRNGVIKDFPLADEVKLCMRETPRLGYDI